MDFLKSHRTFLWLALLCCPLIGCVLSPLGGFYQDARTLGRGKLQVSMGGGLALKLKGPEDKAYDRPVELLPIPTLRLGLFERLDLSVGGHGVGIFQYSPMYWGFHAEGKLALFPNWSRFQLSALLGAGANLQGLEFSSTGLSLGLLSSYSFGRFYPYVGLRVMGAYLLGDPRPLPSDEIELLVPSKGLNLLRTEDRFTLFLMPALGIQSDWGPWSFGLETDLHVVLFGGQQAPRVAFTCMLTVGFRFQLWRPR